MITVIITVRNLQCISLCFDQVVSQASNPDWPLLRRGHVCDLRQLQVRVLAHQTPGRGEEWSHPVPGLYSSVSSHLLRIQVPGLLTRKCRKSPMNEFIHPTWLRHIMTALLFGRYSHRHTPFSVFNCDVQFNLWFCLHLFKVCLY